MTERLNSSDAEYVETLISNAGQIYLARVGTTQRKGQVNIVLNGGALQPGCFRPLEQTILDMLGCNHFRSFQVFHEYATLNRPCDPIAFRCESYSKFKSGKCFSCLHGGCLKVASSLNSGIPQVTEFGASYYIKTNDQKPFCGNEV